MVKFFELEFMIAGIVQLFLNIGILIVLLPDLTDLTQSSILTPTSSTGCSGFHKKSDIFEFERICAIFLAKFEIDKHKHSQSRTKRSHSVVIFDKKIIDR